MKTIFATGLLMLAYSGLISGQTPSPTATPSPGEADIIKISTALIRVDVTVTDGKGKVITDLRPDEIEIYENGEKQKVSSFSFLSSVRTSREVNPTEKTTVVLPPSQVRPEAVRRTIALVVDDLTLSFESTNYVRRALKKFVDEQMQDGDLVAIIRTGAGIGALQQFTNDRRQLYAAIERVRWNPIGNGHIGAFAPLEAKVPSVVPTPVPEPGERSQEGMIREFDEFRESVFAAGTLGAVNYVVRGMQDLPGRKSILLLSDGFKLVAEDALGFRESGRVLQAMRRLIDMANRASVVIYTMDARGLQSAALTAIDNTSGRTMDEVQQAMFDRRGRLTDTQAGLQFLAQQTGGIAIVNSNDLSGGIRKVLDDQSYYLVGYEPDSATFDPRTSRFNKLEIKVTRPGAHVRYRSGFFGIADDISEKPPESAEQRLMTALTSPFAVNQVTLRLNPLFYHSERHGNVIRSLVHIRADDMKFTDEPNGDKKGVFDVVGMAFGDNGTIADQISKTYTMIVPKGAFEAVKKNGIVYEFSFPIKSDGAYQLRVALHDHGSDRVGSANQFVEVPNLKKGGLLLSGMALESLSLPEWQRRNSGQASTGSDAMTDTSLRQFKRGTVMNYGFSIYNAKMTGTKPDLTYKTSVFRDGKAVFESSGQAVVAPDRNDSKAVGLVGAIALGNAMAPGDYVFQITITDNLANGSRNTATQFVQFEIVE